MIRELAEHLAGFSGAELDAELRQIELDHRALEARRAVVLATAEARRLHRVDGHHAMTNYVRATCNSSRSTAQRQMRLARLIDAVPAVGDVLGAGLIGMAQADQLADVHANRRVREFLPAVVDMLLEQAEHLPFDDFRVCVEQFVMLADLDGAFRDTAESVGGRSARVVAVGDSVDVAASGGDPLTAEKLIRIFQRFVRAEFGNDVDARRAEFGDQADQHPLPRTAAQRKFDALEAIFDAAVVAPADGRAPEPVVNLVADTTTIDEAFTRAGLVLPSGDQVDVDDFAGVRVRQLVDELTADPARLLERRCQTASGIPVHPVLVLQAMITGHVRRVVVDSAGVVIDMGHLQRLFTGSPRIAAMVLARHCSRAGCDVPANLADVDHMDEWAADGGATDQHNADIECQPHDRFKHRHRWKSRRSASGRVYHIRPDNTIVLPVGERPPDLTTDQQTRLARQRIHSLITDRQRR